MANMQRIESQDPQAWTKIKDTRYYEIPELPDVPFLAPDKGTKWEFDEDMSSEFEDHGGHGVHGNKINPEKWLDYNPTWNGRAPSFFMEENVYVHDESLFLRSHVTNNKPEGLDERFHTYATSFVRTKKTRLYGYFEIMCRLMDSNISSAFWFSNPTKKLWTEIDVFEYSTSDNPLKQDKRLHWDRLFNTNIHVHRCQGGKVPKLPWSKSKSYDLDFSLSDRRVKIGFNWQKDRLEWYFNDVLIRKEKNEYFHQPLHLQLDSESFPHWFGLPDKNNPKLPNIFRTFYVRTWYQVPADAGSSTQHNCPGK